MEYNDKVLNERLYLLNPGGFCGVFMPEHVMKKITKLHYKYTNEVKKILTQYKDELYPYDWTLANEKDGDKITKQIIVAYILEETVADVVMQRIELFEASKPEYKPEIFRVKTREEAAKIAELKLKEAGTL